MLIMAVDHASGAYNADKLVTDSVVQYNPEMALPALQFWVRWLSHLCAPTFLFLAGTSLALSIERKRQRGVPERQSDRDLLVRGAIIIGLDLAFINLFWGSGGLLLQVLYAIGGAMIVMIPARRLPTGWLVGGGLAVLALTEVLLPNIAQVPEPLQTVLALLFSFGRRHGLLILYPIMPWMAVMALGWGFGRYLVKASDDRSEAGDGARAPMSPATALLILGALSLAVFAVLRGLNGFGNMALLRYDSTLIQWAHVSKYPPSLTFVSLELGIMALVMSGLFWYHGRRDEVSQNHPVLVFGQTALFFYLAHIMILELSSEALSMHKTEGLPVTLTAAAIVVVGLYVPCRAYRSLKARHPKSLLRYI